MCESVVCVCCGVCVLCVCCGVCVGLLQRSYLRFMELVQNTSNPDTP